MIIFFEIGLPCPSLGRHKDDVDNGHNDPNDHNRHNDDNDDNDDRLKTIMTMITMITIDNDDNDDNDQSLKTITVPPETEEPPWRTFRSAFIVAAHHFFFPLSSQSCFCTKFWVAFSKFGGIIFKIITGIAHISHCHHYWW